MGDARDSVCRKRDPEIPPKRLQHLVGEGDFRAIGEEFATLLRQQGLQPSDRLLDVGSGLGRLAIPLTRYLSANGSYDGLEIMPRAVRWCARQITPSYPAFRFHHADVFNQLYNPTGSLPAETFRFPFGADTFDFAVLLSVFTHMLPTSVQQYLAELARVLKPGGTVLITAFLLDPASQACVAAGRSSLDFSHPIDSDGVMTNEPAIPEAAVAYPSEYFKRLVASSGLIFGASVQPGAWSGRPDGVGVQDVVVLKAPSA